MFIDQVTVEIKAGTGGNGKVAYRREKYVAMGGPAGGNGGSGGNIYFIGDEGKTTLLDLKYNRHIRALNGEHGKTKGMFGKQGEDTYIKVPLGTIVYRDNGSIIGEIIQHGEALLIAKGGKGGRGNMSFASNRNKAPDFAEKGDPGETFHAKVELKVLADVGLLGYPSVGKSTLISVISNAKAKIAEYPFTTLHPQLGMVLVDENSFVVADLPGLIENAHLGVGLGIQFLRHVERCRILLHMVSMDSNDPYQDYLNINKELSLYDEGLKNKKQIVVANKMDVPGAKEKLKDFQAKLKSVDVIPMSALQQEGLDHLKYMIVEGLKEIPKKSVKKVIKHYRFEDSSEADFTIQRGEDGVLHIVGKKVELLFHRTDFNNQTAVKRFARQLRLLGIDDALKEAGVQHGETVRIFDYEFEYLE